MKIPEAETRPAGFMGKGWQCFGGCRLLQSSWSARRGIIVSNNPRTRLGVKIVSSLAGKRGCLRAGHKIGFRSTFVPIDLGTLR